METRLTTDQKIPGSTPGRLEFLLFEKPSFCVSASEPSFKISRALCVEERDRVRVE